MICTHTQNAEEKQVLPETWGPFTALGSCLRKYAQFKGRASRSEYWYAVLGNFILNLIFPLLITAGILLSLFGDYNVTTCNVLTIIIASIYLFYQVLFFVPSLALIVRRLHDTGRSGCVICFSFIPLAGPFIMLYFMLSPSCEANRYGNEPEPIADKSKGGAFINCFLAFINALFRTWKRSILSWCSIFFICWFTLWLVTPPYYGGFLTENNEEYKAANRQYRRTGEIADILSSRKCLMEGFLKYLIKDNNTNHSDPQRAYDYHRALNGSYYDLEEFIRKYAPDIPKEIAAEAIAHVMESPFLYISVKQEIALDIAKVCKYDNEGFMYDMLETEASLHDLITWTLIIDREDLTKILIEKGGKITYSHFEIAIQNNNVKKIELLLQHGADVNLEDERGYTLLHNAAANSHVELVQLLLQHGANVNLASPLHSAAANGHIELAQLLIQHGANVNLANKRGYTPLLVAVEKGRVELAQLLIQHGANVNSANKSGYTPLHYAVEKGSDELTQLLLQHGANVNSANKSGYTPLHYAVEKGNDELTQLLIQHGANVNATTNEGDTPLAMAVRSRNEKIVDILLSSPDIDVNAISIYGFRDPDVYIDRYESNTKAPILNIASARGNVNIVKKLLSHPQIDIEARDSNGNGPWSISANQEIYNILIFALK